MTIVIGPPGESGRRGGGPARLNEVWDETADRVARFLRSRGVRATDDIIQEVALRALRSAVPFRDADDLVPWACTVAWRVHIGDCRRQRRRVEHQLVADLPSDESVEDAAASRLRFVAVIEAIATLEPRDRRLLLGTMADGDRGQDSGSATAGCAAVARHRARARLRKALGGRAG